MSKLNLNLPKANGLFITATDTEVGKTLVAGAICNILADDGVSVAPFKPVATGCKKIKGELVSTDAQFLKKYSGTDLPLEIINPIRYEVPAAPVVSGRAEGRPVDLKEIVEPYKQICETHNFVVVEGIGGVRVPIADGVDTLGLAKEFDLPVIIVARANLGTINHTLLTIDAVKNEGLELAGVIISGLSQKTKSIAEKTAADIIIEYGGTDVMAVIPYDRTSNTEKLKMGKTPYYALEEIPFLGMGSK